MVRPETRLTDCGSFVTLKDQFVLTIILLVCSNAFMTLAWYGHLKFKTAPLIVAILVSWLIALPEYILQVPANRYGHADAAETEAGKSSPERVARRWWRGHFSAPQLKILQEIITISVFVAFNFLVLRETIRPTDWAAFGLIVLAVFVMMAPRALASQQRHEAIEQQRSVQIP
jgi:uncharacterized protein (DUF486 family)